MALTSRQSPNPLVNELGDVFWIVLSRVDVAIRFHDTLDSTIVHAYVHHPVLITRLQDIADNSEFKAAPLAVLEVVTEEHYNEH